MIDLASFARRTATLALVLAALLLPGAASAAYRLGAGDVVEIAVFGLPDYNRRVTVNVDGDLSLPFLGEVRAAGMSLPELRVELARGLEANGAVRNPQVTVQLVEHRPFYISGDVARPGAHAYRPGLTVRHAIALAGGFEMMRSRSENPLLLAPEAQSEHASAWLGLVKTQARLISLKAELDGTDEVDFSGLAKSPVSPGVVVEITEAERSNLKERIGSYRREVEFLQRSIAKAQEQADHLAAAVTQQADVVKRQEDVLERASSNLMRGVTSQMRVDEDSRGLAGLKAQHTDTVSRAAQARTEVRELQRRLARIGEDRQIRLTRELQDGSVQVDRYRAQVRGSGEKLLVAGQLKSRLRVGAEGPDLVVHRRSGTDNTVIEASADTALEPDDVLEVTVKIDLLSVN